MWKGLLISLWKWMIHIYQILEQWEFSQKGTKNEFAKGRSKSESILRLEHFLKPCVLCDYKEKEKWSDLKLGATSNLMQFYFKVEVK